MGHYCGECDYTDWGFAKDKEAEVGLLRVCLQRGRENPSESIQREVIQECLHNKFTRSIIVSFWSSLHYRRSWSGWSIDSRVMFLSSGLYFINPE